MSLSIGIVGLPNVGKSTLFNALVKNALAEARRAHRSSDETGGAKVGSFPFTTIEPNVGIVAVPDERLDKLAELEKSDKIVPAAIKFIDIAGLIRGAHKGEGLGNQFLSHIREVDAIALVVRTFAGDTIHVEGSIDPKRDLETILTELALADLQIVSKKLANLQNEAKKPGKDGELAKKVLPILEKIVAVLDDGKPAKSVALNSDDADLLRRHVQLLTNKAMFLVLNVDETSVSQDAEMLIKELRLTDTLPTGTGAVVISAKTEAELVALSDEDQKEYLHTLGLKESGLDRLAREAYRALGLISFFTAGPMEARAWTVGSGATAPEAAGAIHTDFQKKFIRAEVVAYDDFVSNGGWKGAPAKGLMHLEGKDYVVKDGDVMFFRHS